MPFTKQQKIDKQHLFKQGLKQCPRCTKPKALSDFSRDKNRHDGLKLWCKEHEKEYNAKPENKAKLKEYYAKSENKERIAKYKKEWAKKNKLEIANYKQLWEKKRRETNINFKIKGNLRHRINMALKGNAKSLSTMFLVGCEIDYLMYHIQEQFTKDMSWDNHGLWHIDHIKPCSKFDLSKKSEQLKCFNFMNLQPLWAEDNLRKGSD